MWWWETHIVLFVVHDDEMLLETIEDYITRKTKHTVEVFKTGEECLENIDQEPDVIILDYNLNAVSKNTANGMKILEAIKKLTRIQESSCYRARKPMAPLCKPLIKGLRNM
jgi:CheY-like chemotaxis protein